MFKFYLLLLIKMNALKKIKHQKSVKELEKATSALSMRKSVKADYLDESFVSEITQEEENNDFDNAINSDGEIDFDNNQELIDYVDDEEIGEEKASKNHMIDNQMSFSFDIILSTHFRNICRIFNITEQDDRFSIQKSINSYLVKTQLKSVNDEVVITALEIFDNYPEYTRLTSIKEYIKVLIDKKYLKFPGITTSSFIKISSNDPLKIYELYIEIFGNAKDFIQKLSGKNYQQKTIGKYDERIFNESIMINPPMNPDIIKYREFSLELFTELQNDMSQAYTYKFSPLLHYVVDIISLSARATTINWSTDIVPIQNKPEITNIPIILRNLISMKMNKWSSFTKDDLIQVLMENPKLIKNIKNFLKFLKVYNDKKMLLSKKRTNDDMKIDIPEKPFSNLFIKKRRN